MHIKSLPILFSALLALAAFAPHAEARDHRRHDNDRDRREHRDRHDSDRHRHHDSDCRRSDRHHHHHDYRYDSRYYRYDHLGNVLSFFLSR